MSVLFSVWTLEGSHVTLTEISPHWNILKDLTRGAEWKGPYKGLKKNHLQVIFSINLSTGYVKYVSETSLQFSSYAELTFVVLNKAYMFKELA